MKTLKQLFSYMNDISFRYVVLRNWDQLPYDVVLGEHSDLDLLVDDFDHFREIFSHAVLEHNYPRVRMKIPIGESFIYMDVRHVGDDYYPTDFERAILDTRELNDRGFYTPNPIHHRIALAYHAVHHKNDISRDYRRFLGHATINELREALQISNVGWVRPKDPSVGAFNGYWRGATSTASLEDGRILKKQIAYLEYDLIKNEFEKLMARDSVHFPRVYGHNVAERTITIEHCGEPLTVDNIPDDWRVQLPEILVDLGEIMHRDIRFDNLMIKDGIIKLIDFGWAKFSYEVELKEPPSCLGFPNKCSTGFSDAYSMRRVVKQIEYLIDEKQEKEALCESLV